MSPKIATLHNAKSYPHKVIKKPPWTVGPFGEMCALIPLWDDMMSESRLSCACFGCDIFFWSYISLNSKVQWQRQMKQLSTFKNNFETPPILPFWNSRKSIANFSSLCGQRGKKIKFLSCSENLTTARQSRDRKGIKLGERERENKPWCIPLWLAQSTVTWKRSIFDPILLAFISTTIRIRINISLIST